MKVKFILLLTWFPVMALGQVYKKHGLQKDRLSIQLSEGVLNIVPLSDKAIRVQWEKDKMKEEKEFVLINTLPVPAFTVSETAKQIKVGTNTITVIFNKQTAGIAETKKTIIYNGSRIIIKTKYYQ